MPRRALPPTSIEAAPPPMGAAIGYVRVSTDQQAGEKQTSLEDQRTAITQLAARIGVTVAQWFEDAGFSGRTVQKRPALRALLAHCAAHPRPATAPGYVLVLNDSRFGRFTDPDEAAALRFRLRECGWLVRFAEADDVQDPSLRHIMRAVGGAQASEYSRNLSANSRRGRDGTVRQGFWAGREPFGYRRRVVYPAAVARDLAPGQWKAKGEKIKLVPGPAEEVETVREIFARYVLQGQSLRAIARWLQASTVPGVGGRPWPVVSVRAILDHHAYIGGIPVRRRRPERTAQGDWSRQPPEYVVDHAHEPLVDRALWERAQEQLAGIAPRGGVHDYRVRGLVTCPDCGEPYVGGGHGGRLAAGGRTRYYVDRGGRDGRCARPIGNVAAHLLEAAIIRQLDGHLRTELAEPVIARAIAQRVARATTAQQGDSRARRLADVDRRIGRLVDAVERGALASADVHTRMQQLKAERSAIEHAPDPRAAYRQATATVEQLTALARDVVRCATVATGAELRTLLRPWLARAAFDRRTRELTLWWRPLALAMRVAEPGAARPVHALSVGSSG